MGYAYGGRVRPNNNRSRNGGGQRSRSGGGHKKYIDPRKFVKAAEPLAEQTEYMSKHRFIDFDVSDVIKRNLTANGFDTPTPIQDQTIPLVIEGNDLLGIADTGTGKTAAFGIPILNKLIANKQSRALIVAPTRELAEQIEQQLRMLAKGSGLFGALLIGGENMAPQLRDLRANPQVVVGTPGRIKDHLNKGKLELSGFDTIVLDEVDRMLDMGFVNDITEIMDSLSPSKQCLYFSATLDDRVSDIIRRFSKEIIKVSVKSGDTSKNVDQNVVEYSHSGQKVDKLHNILTDKDVLKVLIFEETKRGVENLSDKLMDRGHRVEAIHGNKSQSQRKRALQKFQKNEVKILIATDVAARGLDVPDVTHVINFSTPNTYDDYVHRIGRTGRAGKKGFALTFVESRQGW